MAIAFNSFSEGISAASATSVSVSHTPAGSQRLLIVGVIDEGGDTVTGVTFNSVSMTQLRKAVCGVGYVYLYYLIAPDATTANIVASRTSTTGKISAGGWSITGARQSGVPDASTNTTTNGTQTSVSPNVTTIADNCWAIMVCYSDNALNITASTNATQRGGANNGYEMFDNSGVAPITPAGSFTMTATTVSGSNFIAVMATFAPASATFTSQMIII